MVFLSKEQVLELFKNSFEIIEFNEIEKDGKTGLNVTIRVQAGEGDVAKDITGMVGGEFAFVKNGKISKIFTIGQLKMDMKKT